MGPGVRFRRRGTRYLQLATAFILLASTALISVAQTQTGMNRVDHDVGPAAALQVEGTTSSTTRTTPAAEQLSSTPPYPNPPLWPADSVTILHPDDEQPPGQKQQILDELFTDHGRYSVDSAKGTFRERPDVHELPREFSLQRRAIFFLPGKHAVSVSVGYYMHVLGLGVRRNDTKIGTVQVLNGSPDFRIGALVNFWRKAENFHTDNDLNWWVSQASTLRRVSINGNLHLSGMDWASFNFGFASGGFLADVEVGTASGGGGVVNAGSQQQFCFRNIRTRNPELEKDAFRGGAWNFVFIGSPTVVGQHGAGVRDDDVVSTGASSGSDQKLTVIDTAPIIAEKPFIVATRTRRRRSTSTIDRDYLYHIVVPPAVHNRTTDSSPVVVPGGSWHRDEAERPAVQELLLDQSANHVPAVEEALGEHEEDEQVEDDASRLHRRWSRVVSFDRVYVAEPPAPDEDITIAEATVDRINEALSTTGSVVLTPGIYRLAKPIVLSRPKSVLLGIGLATLVCEAASPCLLVHNSARGSRVSGLIVQPGVTFSGEVLVEIGTSGDEADERTSEAEVVEPRSAEEDAEEHIFLYDVFARVGGDTDSRRETVNVSEAMMRVYCSRVVLDNIWLWRADHDVGGAVRDGRNFVKNALQVFGERVTFYGLAAEHALDDQVVWKGNFGRVYFFQSEFAYDLEAPVVAGGRSFSGPVVPSESKMSPALTSTEDQIQMSEADDHDIVAYRLAPRPRSPTTPPTNSSRSMSVTKTMPFAHDCRGLSMYSFFRDHDVRIRTAMLVFPSEHVHVEHACTFRLNGHGGIEAVITVSGSGSSSTDRDTETDYVVVGKAVNAQFPGPAYASWNPLISGFRDHEVR